MAVPVSDTAHRPKNGEAVMVIISDGAQLARYVESSGPVMFDVEAPSWLDVITGEPMQPTHWLRVIPTDMPFVKWPVGCTMTDDEKQRLADALADGPSGHIFVLDEAPSYPLIREEVKRMLIRWTKKGRTQDMVALLKPFNTMRQSEVCDADLPRLLEALLGYEQERPTPRYATPPSDFMETVRRKLSDTRKAYLTLSEEERLSAKGLAQLRLIQALGAVLRDL